MMRQSSLFPMRTDGHFFLADTSFAMFAYGTEQTWQAQDRTSLESANMSGF
jgi:hypothetical protein